MGREHRLREASLRIGTEPMDGVVDGGTGHQIGGIRLS